MASKLRDAILTAEEKTEKRKLNLMVLILHHLQSHGFVKLLLYKVNIKITMGFKKLRRHGYKTAN